MQWIDHSENWTFDYSFKSLIINNKNKNTNIKPHPCRIVVGGWSFKYPIEDRIDNRVDELFEKK